MIVIKKLKDNFVELKSDKGLPLKDIRTYELKQNIKCGDWEKDYFYEDHFSKI